MNRIRVVYAYVSFYRGAGGEMHPYALARYLDRDAFDFSICVIDDAQSPIRGEIEKLDCPIHVLHLSRRLYGLVHIIRLVYGFYALFKKLNPHIVHTQALHANVLARLGALCAGVPAVITTENALPDIESRLFHRLFNLPFYALNHLLDRYTQAILVVSEHLRRWKDPRGSSSKLAVVPPPLFDEDTRVDAVHRPFSNPGRVLIGNVSRLSAEKGHRYLIEALPRILSFAPAAEVLLIGSGPLETELKKRVHALGLTPHVHFMGYTRQVADELARMDLFCLPSLSEACPIVLLEALAMGRPIIASRVGGVPDIVMHGVTGLLVPPKNADALAQAVQDLLASPEEAVQMGLRGRSRVMTDFHVSKFIEAHETLYRRLGTVDTASLAAH